ncbi:MAG TPA: hypothetical protein V6C97_27235, partial [Oculatellaceae cyanobacterium]
MSFNRLLPFASRPAVAPGKRPQATPHAPHDVVEGHGLGRSSTDVADVAGDGRHGLGLLSGSLPFFLQHEAEGFDLESDLAESRGPVEAPDGLSHELVGSSGS